MSVSAAKLDFCFLYQGCVCTSAGCRANPESPYATSIDFDLSVDGDVAVGPIDVVGSRVQLGRVQ